MPVILNLIKESLKPVTLGAVGGHAIAPVLLFLASISHFLSVFPNQLVSYSSNKKPGSERKPASAELTPLSVHTSSKAKKQVPSI